MPGEWDEVTQIRKPAFVDAASNAPRILVADTDHYRKGWLRHVLAGHFGLEEVDSGRAALEHLSTRPPRLMIVGPQLADVSGGVLLAHASRHGLLSPQSGGPITFLIGDSPAACAQVDEQEVPVFYRLTPGLEVGRVRELMTQAIARLPQLATKPQQTEEDAMRTRAVLEHAKRLGAQRDLKGAARSAVGAVIDLLAADRARCLYCDDETGSLWAEGGAEEESHEAQASAGIAGFAVRTRSTVVLPHAREDQLYAPAVDDPDGQGSERLAVTPVVDREGTVHAVLIAVRTADHPPFTEDDVRKLEGLAQAWAPFVHQLAQEVEAEQVLENRRNAEAGGGELFRQEAIVHLVRRGHRGDVVRVHPGWVQSAYWMVVLSLIAGFGFAAIAQIHQYAEGPSVVRFIGRTELHADEPGTVTSIDVVQGQEVEEGQLLAKLHDTEQAGRLRGLEQNLEAKEVAYLQTPGDPKLRETIAQLNSDLETARSSAAARQIRAPHAGVVKDVLVHEGQRVDAGKSVLSIAEKGATEGLAVVAFLPGSERPRLRAGQRLRMTLPGYRGAQLDMRVQRVSDVLGGEEARAQYLRDRLADSLPIQGTVVVVQAMLRTAKFESDGEVYELHDGMLGRAEIQLESRSVLESMIPGLEQ